MSLRRHHTPIQPQRRPRGAACLIDRRDRLSDRWRTTGPRAGALRRAAGGRLMWGVASFIPPIPRRPRRHPDHVPGRGPGHRPVLTVPVRALR